MQYPSNLSNQTVGALYLRAEALEQRWRNARLSDEFSGRMIDAVLRHLRRLEDNGQAVRGEGQHTFAVHLLNVFWSRNARRDFARISNKADISSTHCDLAVLPLQSAVALDDAIAEVLIRAGESACITWAFLFRRSGMRWKDVAEAVAHRTGQVCTPAQARQWERRHFKRLEEKISNSEELK